MSADDFQTAPADRWNPLGQPLFGRPAKGVPPTRPCHRGGPVLLLAGGCAECGEEFLVAAFFVARCFFFGVPLCSTGEDCLGWFDDEEEDGGCDRNELDQRGDEGAVLEERVVDGEG